MRHQNHSYHTLYELAIIVGVYHMRLYSKTLEPHDAMFLYDNQMKTITRIKQYEQICYNFQ
jgi:hypothetical protein